MDVMNRGDRWEMSPAANHKNSPEVLFLAA
jgi:hypothetical protein